MGEAYITRRGGGGNPLNFKVVGGNTAPSTPSENTIWVNTHVGITSWYFGADEPNYHEEGTVWIITGASSSAAFNALKKNSITVYPISAKLFSGGMWWDLEAKSWQGGAWVGWITKLYDNGNQCTGKTGGWVAQTNSTIESNCLVLKDSQQAAQLSTSDMVDVTGISAIHVVFKVVSVSSTANDLKCGISENSNFETYLVRAHEVGVSAGGTYILSVDVSTFKGSYYIKVGAYCCRAEVTEVYGA